MTRLCAGITEDLGAMEVYYYSIILLFYYYGVRNQIFYSNIWYAEPDGVQQRVVCGNRLCVEPDRRLGAKGSYLTLVRVADRIL